MRTVRPPRLGVRGPATLLLAVVTLVALSACGDDSEPSTDATTSSASTPVASSSSEEPSEEPSETESEEPTEVETTEVAGPDVDIVVTIAGDDVTTPSNRVAVEIGQTVRITVTGEADDEVHVHGFELELPITAGTPGVLEFEVGAEPGPGLYEVETHESELLLFQIEVR